MSDDETDRLRADIEDLRRLLNAQATELINLRRANPPAGAAGTVAAGATAQTALATTTGQLNVDQPIQYGTKSGDYLYGLAVEPLDLKFDMTSGDTVVFIKLLAARSKEMGWSEGAMNITRFDVDTTGTAPNIKDLFTQYGQIPAKVIKERCDKFVTGPDVQTRSSQNNAMMHKCLLASLTDEARRKLTACESDYIFNNEVYAPLLFKTIMRLATIDSKATTNFLRESLNNCDSYMVKCSSDINQFNLFFTTTYTQLLGRGE